MHVHGALQSSWHMTISILTVICILGLVLYNLQCNLVWFYHDKKTPHDMKQHPIAARHNKCRSDGIIPCLCWNMIIIIMVTNGNGHCWSVTNCECDFCCCYCCCSYSLLHCVPIFWPCILHHEQLDCSLRLPCLRLFPQLQQLLLALKAKSRRFGFLVGAAKNVHQKVKHMSDNNLLKQRRNVTQLNGPLQHWTTSTKTHNPLHQKKIQVQTESPDWRMHERNRYLGFVQQEHASITPKDITIELCCDCFWYGFYM